MAGTNAVDVHVGDRIRARRKEIGATQAALGAAVGCSFQQVQKYERGTNRVSASALWIMASFLAVEIDWFFAGLAHDDHDRSKPAGEQVEG